MPELLPFQKQCVAEMLSFLKNNETHSCYNACEPGLGKTCQSLMTCEALNCRRILIICPAVMRLVWQEEIKKWLGLEAEVILKSSDFGFISDVMIFSYDLAAKKEITARLSSWDWDCLITDEHHFLKAFSAKRTRQILKYIWPKAKYHIALSGTPFTKNVVDGFTAFHKMLPSEFPTFKGFVKEYCYEKFNGFATVYYGVKNAEKLREIIRSGFYIRRLKKDVLTELPEKNFQKIVLPSSYFVKPTEETTAAYADVLAVLESGRSPGVVPKCLAEEKRLQGEKKVPAVVEFVKDLLDQEIPVVVFAWHRSVISKLSEELKEYGPQVITGDTGMGERAAAVQNFQAGSSPLFIGQFAAAGVGITLTKSSTVVMAELDWSPATINQACDRVHRIGQTNRVNIYYFSVKDSIDEKINNVLMSKVRDFAKVLD